ncbi:Gldg family protein [Pirellulaceae bacterium SH449]
MNNVLAALTKLLVLDLIFLGVILVVVMTLSMSRKVGYAVLKRNFYGYFSNPTGYVFLCLFVLLTGLAAFWPDEFFSSNLGTLAQLNKWFTFIMLFFIPAITMSIWAEERRQGTDELLLTLPADDFDIVIGKYVAAAAIYSVSLLFSQFSTFLVLAYLTLGDIDTGLFFTNYLGYWFIGLAMISIGMVASFLTNNLTVGFILGALFNAPLAFASSLQAISDQNVTRWVKNYSVPERFDDFGRGVISLSSISYFVLLTVLGLYVCMVLIGKRHWSSGSGGNQRLGHYLLRIILIVVMVLGGVMLFRNKDQRLDATELKISSLSPVTKELIRSLGSEREIIVDAYLSDVVPDDYARIKYEIVSTLKEFQATASSAGVALQLRIFDSVQTASEEEKQAEQQYGIVPQPVRSRERGEYSDDAILLGAAIRSGLQKVVIPFFEPGIPVEYELVRSLTTVSKPTKKKLGILNTDAQLMGGFNASAMRPTNQHPIVAELAKQYDVVSISAASPIDVENLDVLLAVQPSSLSPEDMTNFIEAVKNGLPTAIFEDPQAAFWLNVPGTGEPKQAGGPMAMFGGGGMQPKGDIRPLWRLLGIDIPSTPGAMGLPAPDYCWHEFNPYPILRNLTEATDLWVFASKDAIGGEDAFSDESEITSGLREVMLPFPSVIRPMSGVESVTVTPLIKTGTKAGTISQIDVNSIERSSLSRATEYKLRRSDSVGQQILAVLVQGKDDQKKDSSADGIETTSERKSKPIHAVYVSDIDILSEVFVNLRNRPSEIENINFQFQNITFLLNTIDVLAGETRFPQIRKHVPVFSTLKLIEIQSEKALEEEEIKRREFSKNYNEAIAKREEENSKVERELRERIENLRTKGNIDAEDLRALEDLQFQLQAKAQNAQKRFIIEKERLQRERDAGIRNAKNDAKNAIRKIQDFYKWIAVAIPPIPPLLVGIIVMVSRRLREREGISKNRLK